ncbi:MAG: hypothetical protein E6J41_19595 [Chloroflexi bacterium]|nr:MAG: hypothetical protein E6J41_19595 [Chloroflexota bacterium]
MPLTAHPPIAADLLVHGTYALRRALDRLADPRAAPVEGLVTEQLAPGTNPPPGDGGPTGSLPSGPGSVPGPALALRSVQR